MPEELWVCNFCGHTNREKETHCLICTCPSDEAVEQIRQDKMRERKKKEEEKRRRESRNSSSVEREVRKKKEQEKKQRFQVAMSQDSKSMPCMPQRIGEARFAQRASDGGFRPEGASLSTFMARTGQERRTGEADRRQWDSDDEAYDDFGRLKKKRRAVPGSEGDGGTSASGSGVVSAGGSSLSAKQQAALARLQNKAKRPPGSKAT